MIFGDLTATVGKTPMVELGRLGRGLPGRLVARLEMRNPWLALVLVSMLFGVGHAYKGPSGIIDSGVGGFVFGAAYLLSGRNLWTAVLAHGFVDMLGIGLLYVGLAS